ncbi:peptide deformylase [Pseudoroseomonas globiformis]|uniref:Peptide deformylase n=1 Tax=Teichococcus globiformis TaxID=2307229 RepID=A0ABV7FZF7_9PROT
MPETNILPILYVPAPELRAKARPVADADMDQVRSLVPSMLETMYKAPGIGLAAPQIGRLLRLVVIDLQPDDQPAPLVMINPEILEASDDLEVREEGCLSLPNQYADVARPAVIRVRWHDLEGKRQEMQADGLLATCIQHEVDHLNGVLFVDHISALKRNMLLRRLAKELKTKSRDEA